MSQCLSLTTSFLPPQLAIPDLVEASSSADILVFVIPHQFVGKVCDTIKGKIKSDAVGISLIKVRLCSCALWISHLLSLNFGCDAILMFYARLFGQVKGAVRLLCSDTNIGVKSRPFWCTIMGPYFRKIMQGSERDAAWWCLVWRLTLWPFLCAEVMIMFEMSIEWDDVVHWAVPQNNHMYLTVKVKYIWLNTKTIHSKWDFLDLQLFLNWQMWYKCHSPGLGNCVFASSLQICSEDTAP